MIDGNRRSIVRYNQIEVAQRGELFMDQKLAEEGIVGGLVEIEEVWNSRSETG